MDVVIIGTGPASFAAAHEILKAGYNVIVISGNNIEKSKDEPSQSVHPGLESMLNYLGMPGLLEKVARSTYTGIWTNGNYRPLNELNTEAWIGFHIDRNKFDQEIREELLKRHVQILENCRIDHFQIEPHEVLLKFSDGRIVRSRYLIDGSGSGRVMSKKLPFKKHVYSPTLITSSILVKGIYPESFAELKTSFTSDKNGWTWLAPESPDKCTWTRMNVSNEIKVQLPAEFENCEVGPMRQSNVRWNIFRPLFYKRVLLCGDAGAILDPGTGQGILTALLSGIKAGKAIAQCLGNESGSAPYLEEYDEWFFSHFMTTAATLYEYYDEMKIAGFSNTHLIIEV